MPEPAAIVTSSAVTGGLWILGTVGGQDISIAQFGVATGLSVLGALSYQFIRAYSKREEEEAKGIPPSQRTRVDMLTVAYALAAAPLAAGLLMWMIQALGGTANSLYSVGGFYGAGAFAPLVVGSGRQLISRFLAPKGVLP